MNKKILGLVLAIVMVFGSILPTVTYANEVQEPETLLLEEETLDLEVYEEEPVLEEEQEETETEEAVLEEEAEEPAPEEEPLADIIPYVRDASGNFPVTPGYATVNFMIPRDLKDHARLEGVTSYRVNPEAGLTYREFYAAITLPKIVVTNPVYEVKNYGSAGNPWKWEGLNRKVGSIGINANIVKKDIVPNVRDASGKFPETPGYVTVNFMIPRDLKDHAHLEGITSYRVNPEAGLTYREFYAAITLPKIVVTNPVYEVKNYGSAGNPWKWEGLSRKVGNIGLNANIVKKDIVPNVRDANGNFPVTPGYVTVNFMIPRDYRNVAHLEGITSYRVNPEAGLTYREFYAAINLPTIVIDEEGYAYENYGSTGLPWKWEGLSRKVGNIGINANIVEVVQDIEAVREEAIKTIRALENLFNAEKTRFVNRVYQATTIEEIQAIVEEAIQKDAENLQKAKDQLIRTINNGYYSLIPQEELDAYIERIENATTKKEIEAIKAELDFRHYQIHMIGAAEEEMVFLVGDLLEPFITRIEEATSIQEIQEIFAEMRVADYEEGVRQAEALMETLDRLTEEQKQGYLNRIYRTNSAAVVRQIMDEAIKANAEAEDPTDPLVGLKELAKEEIDALEYLEDAQKEAYKARIDEATTEEEIEAIVEEAKEANLAIFKEAAIAILHDKGEFPYLTDADRDLVIGMIEAAPTEDEVYEALMVAIMMDMEEEQLVLAKRAEAIEEIQAMEHLSEEEKQAFINRVNEAMSVELIEEILEEARETGADVGEAVEYINGLEYVLQMEKDAFIERLNGATTEEEIQVILDEANALNISFEEAKKRTRIFYSNQYTNMTFSQRTFQTAINNATTMEELDGIIAEVMVIVEQNIQKKQQELIKLIDSLPYLTDEERVSFKETVLDTWGITNLERVEEQINLANKKVAYALEVEALEFLSREEKDYHIEQLQQKTSLRNLDSALSTAKHANLVKAREAYREKINNIEGLTEEQREGFLREIVLASLTKLEDIYARALEAVVTNLEEAKAEALLVLENLDKLTEEEVVTFTSRINASETVAEVHAALREARAAHSVTWIDSLPALENLKIENRREIKNIEALLESFDEETLALITNLDVFRALQERMKEIEAADSDFQAANEVNLRAAELHPNYHDEEQFGPQWINAVHEILTIYNDLTDFQKELVDYEAEITMASRRVFAVKKYPTQVFRARNINKFVESYTPSVTRSHVSLIYNSYKEVLRLGMQDLILEHERFLEILDERGFRL